MANTEEEGPFLATTSQSEQRYMRLTGYQKAKCLTCNQSGTRTNHVQNLSQELGTTPTPKKNKPPTPADHIISILTEEFKQAFLDDEAEDVKVLLIQYDLFGTTYSDILKFDHSELIKYVKITHKLIEPKSQPPLVPATTPISPPPQPQSVSMKLPRAEPTKWTGLNYEFYP